jgi:hypothetical protein
MSTVEDHRLRRLPDAQDRGDRGAKPLHDRTALQADAVAALRGRYRPATGRASEAHDAVARLVRAGSAQHREPPVLAGRAVTTGMDDHGSERLGDQEHG